MRPSKIVYLAFLLTACNGSNIGPFEGKILNHTTVAMDDLKLEISLICRKPAFIGPAPRCGTESLTLLPDAEGRFTVPQLQVPSGLGYEYEFRAHLGVSKEAMLGRDLVGGIWSASDGRISKLAKELQSITLFELADQELSFALASGTPSGHWATGQGRDSYLEYRFDFTLGKEDVLFHNQILRLGKAGLSSHSLESFGPALLAVPGAHRADAPVLVNAKIQNSVLDKARPELAVLQQEIRFSPVLPYSLRQFSVDDSSHPTIERKIDGTWDALLQFTSRPGEKYVNNLADAKASFTCTAGRLSGFMDVQFRGGSTLQWSGRVPLEGTCAGEEGNARFTMPYSPDAGEVEFEFEFHRVGPRHVMSRNQGQDSWRKEDFLSSAWLKALNSQAVSGKIRIFR